MDKQQIKAMMDAIAGGMNEANAVTPPRSAHDYKMQDGSPNETANTPAYPHPTIAAQQVLQQNSHVPFVKRVLDPSRYPLPQKQYKDGQTFWETHRMATSTGPGGKGYAYPTITYDEQNGYQRPADPYRAARESGNYIEFPNEFQANDFAMNYKTPDFNRYYGEQMNDRDLITKIIDFFKSYQGGR